MSTLYINYDPGTDTHEIKLDDTILLRGEYMHASQGEEVLRILANLLGVEVVDGEYTCEYD